MLLVIHFDRSIINIGYVLSNANVDSKRIARINPDNNHKQIKKHVELGDIQLQNTTGSQKLHQTLWHIELTKEGSQSTSS